jgi:hypothetical protein
VFVVIPLLIRGIARLVRRYRGRDDRVAEVAETSATRP